MQKSVKRNIFVAATYAAVLLLGIIFGQNYVDQNRNVPGNTLVPIGLSDNSYKIQQLIDLVSSAYVDSVDIDSIQSGAINHILSHLDPYSKYLLPSELRAQTEALEGTFEGIGMEYFNLNDTLLVVGLITNGPADLAGFKVGDRILQIDKQQVSGKKIAKEEIEKLIRGKRGTYVDLLISRQGTRNPFIIRVKRDQVNVSSIDVAYMYRPGLAYIKIRRFGLNTAEEFVNALIELKKQGADKIVLDLRDNGGGYFHIAVRLAGEFFNSNTLIVYTEGAHESRRDYFTEKDGAFTEEKLVVLINENTASASEILAGAVQDWDRGIVMGRRSYGKGIVQEQFTFTDGSSVNLSIAKYYTPLGRSIQKKYTPNWSSKFSYSHMYQGLWAMDTLYAHGRSFTTSAGREVFSGGGIYPDIVIPKDTNESSLLYQQIVKSNFIEQFVYERFTRDLPAYSIENFLQGYDLPESEYDRFIEFLATKEIDMTADKKESLHDIIQTDIEAIVGRYYFGREAYFKVKNREDEFLEAALKVLGFESE